MARRGAKTGTKTTTKTFAATTTVRTTKRKKTKGDDGEPPQKLQREDSFNTQLRKAINETKKNQPKKKSFKQDYILASYHIAGPVHEDYSCMLNQTNIGQNNNKFYVIQVAKGIKNNFLCYTRWGRVGEGGTDNTDSFVDVEEAIKAFKTKFKAKTANDWDKRMNFTPKQGKYTMLEMDEEGSEEDELDSKVEFPKLKESSKNKKCSLDKRTQIMIKLIFSSDMFLSQMTIMNLDVRKMPLGKLSKSQIAKGLEVLLDIEKAIKNNANQTLLTSLASKFYTLIPHSFGRSVPPVISDQSTVTQKIEMMITLSDIELTQSLQKREVENLHPDDENYFSLNCKLEYVNRNSETFKMIKKYAAQSPPTWRKPGKLLDVWTVDRKTEGERYKQHNDISFRKLLWHGTNIAVVAAILKAGLRIMPHRCNALYFASQHSKSTGFVVCHDGSFEGESNIGFMFLVETALGNIKKMKFTENFHSMKKAPMGYDSVVVRGLAEPDEKGDIKIKLEEHEVVVPLGKPIVEKGAANCYWHESEYLLHRESQARIRYLLKFHFP